MKEVYDIDIIFKKSLNIIVKVSIFFVLELNILNIVFFFFSVIVLVYVFLGTPVSLIDMMTTMQALQLFEKGEYIVIHVDMMTYTPREATKYLWSELIHFFFFSFLLYINTYFEGIEDL